MARDITEDLKIIANFGKKDAKDLKKPQVFKDVQDNVTDYSGLLTDQEKLLCLNIVKTNILNLAWIDSGYSRDERDDQMLLRPEMQHYIEEIRNRIQAKVSKPREWVQNELIDMYELNKYDPKGSSSALKALDQYCKLSGLDLPQQFEDVSDKEADTTISFEFNLIPPKDTEE